MHNILEIAAKFQTQTFYLSSEKTIGYFCLIFSPVFSFIQF